MKPIAILLSTLLLAQTALNSAQAQPDRSSRTSGHRIAQADIQPPSPQEVQQTATIITVRVTSANNGGSGVIIAQKGSTYLVLTNAHVVRRSTQFQIQAPDGQKYTAKPVDGGFDAKYDLALLEFTSQTKYNLADLSDVASPLAPERAIYSAGFPFDSRDIRITSGQVSQLSDIPFDNGTQIGYTTNKGEKGIRQGMSGGAILDGRGKFIGINTIGATPILPNYTYNDGSKPVAKLVDRYRNVNWGVPVYNFLTSVKPDILYGYDNLPKVERRVTPTGYLAKLNNKARQMTVRIEAGGENGSGVIIAKEGNNYYVLTAKHVVQSKSTKDNPNSKIHSDIKIITYDQDNYIPTSTVVAKNADLAVVKFSSNSNYPLAQLGKYSPNNDDLVFAGGFPGRNIINSPLWQWQLNPGFILNQEGGKFIAQNNLSFSNGYDLYYGSISHGGMSGGPVFDTEGRVIGIHGQAEQTTTTFLGGSLGISIQTFMGLTSKLQVNPQLLKIAKSSPAALNQIDRQTVITSMQNISKPQEGDTGERWLAYGNQLTRTLQFDKSIEAFDKAIAKGEILKGNYGKTLSLLILAKNDLANAAISKAIAAVPNQDRANYYYFWKYQSRILSLLNKHDEALETIDVAIKLNSEDPILENEKAQVLGRNKQYAAAISIYDKLIDKQQPEAYIFSNRGMLKAQLKDFKGALSDTNLAIEINPNSVTAYLIRGMLKAQLKDFKGALSDANRVIEINPNYEAYLVRSQIKLELKDFNGAIADANRGIKLSNVAGFAQSTVPKKYILGMAYFFRTTAKIGLQDIKGAFADVNQSIENNPNFDRAYMLRGGIKLVLKDFQGAIADANQIIKLRNEKDALAVAINILDAAKNGLDDKQGAISGANQSIEFNSNNSELYYNRGVAKHKLGDDRGAISDYTQSIKFNSNNSKVYYERGASKSKLDDKKGAIDDYSQAIKIDPENYESYFFRGLMKYMLGDKRGAIADYDRATKLDRKLYLVYQARGVAKAELGDKKGAIYDYDRAIELNPNDAESRYRRSLIDDLSPKITIDSKTLELLPQMIKIVEQFQ